jgi:serine/threonine-protein kinase
MDQSSLITNRYRIIKHLGSGGFGDTFLAEDTHLPSKRICVVKKLKPIVENPSVYQLVKERFEREAVILEDLGNHPQIPALYAYFEENGSFYLVQEYIEGETLTTFVKNNGIQTETFAKNILIQTLEILEFIQTKGIIHRDIKPDNILINHTNQKPILIDFGAVKETMRTQVISGSSSGTSIVIGTPGYMPPEQSVGRPTFSSDLYALGLTIIYLLTRKNPQEFSTNPMTGEILWKLDALNISPFFSNVLDQAIQSQADKRFMTAQGMKETILNSSKNQGQVSTLIPKFEFLKTEISAPEKLISNWLKISFVVIILGFGSLFLFKYSQQNLTVENKNSESTTENQNLNNPSQEREKPQNSSPQEPEINDTQNQPNIPQTTFTWRSESGLTKINNLEQICRGKSTINSAITVFGYDKKPFQGTININSPKTQGCSVGDSLTGSFDLWGNQANCKGYITITWQNNNNAYIQWNITNLGPACSVGTANWSINTYPVSN